MSNDIKYGEYPLNRIGEAYELRICADRKIYVHPSSIISIEVYSEKTWEFLPHKQRSLIDCLFGINKTPKHYKGKTVYYVGFSMFESPAIETGTVDMMRVTLINNQKIDVNLDINLLNNFLHKKEGDRK